MKPIVDMIGANNSKFYPDTIDSEFRSQESEYKKLGYRNKKRRRKK
ncbi:MAG: hypothetical protein ACXWCG_04380 [Flavitalea sp.]